MDDEIGGDGTGDGEDEAEGETLGDAIDERVPKAGAPRARAPRTGAPRTPRPRTPPRGDEPSTVTHMEVLGEAVGPTEPAEGELLALALPPAFATGTGTAVDKAGRFCGTTGDEAGDAEPTATGEAPPPRGGPPPRRIPRGVPRPRGPPPAAPPRAAGPGDAGGVDAGDAVAPFGARGRERTGV